MLSPLTNNLVTGYLYTGLLKCPYIHEQGPSQCGRNHRIEQVTQYQPVPALCVGSPISEAAENSAFEVPFHVLNTCQGIHIKHILTIY